ncbi:MAG: DUF1206 domain-containing protein [Mycobacteriales bacterium]
MPSLVNATRRAQRSDAAQWGARSGLVARGLLWLVVGILAANVALGGHDQADKHGALATLREQPLGKLLLLLVALAFAAHAVFRGLEAAVGRREWWKRLWSLIKVGVYLFLAGSAARMLFGASGGSEDARKPTARVMSWPAGRWCVGAIGVAIVVTGIVMAVRGFRQDFTDKLTMPSGLMRTVVERAGAVGLTGRGLVYALVGSFLVEAAVRFNPNEAKGLDAALKTLAAQPYGAALLWVAVAALLSFAVWSFLEARYRDF